LGSQCKALAPYRNATRTVSGIAEAYQQGAEGGAKGGKNDDQAHWLMLNKTRTCLFSANAV
jgi:hypothetical protein